MHERDWHAALERGLERFAELIGEDAPLERELAQSERAFVGATRGAPRVLAERRHLEWFVCERPSDVLEGVPVDVLRSAWLERAALEGDARAGDADMLDALLGSLSSAFEVAAVDGGALVLRDLFGLGEYDVAAPVAAGELAHGDLVVGRIFPLDGAHRLSPVAGGFRDRGLIGALRHDVERMRGGRGRVLRMQQSELEALFFQRERAGAPAVALDEAHADAPAPPDPAAARDALVAAGLDAGDAVGAVESLLEVARERPDATGAVTELLNTLAFETEVDLEVARRTLAELWAAAARPSGRDAPPDVADAVGDADTGLAAAEAAAEALRRFDQGRAQGEDLDRLFRQLEQELGVAGDDDEDAEPCPDFPGVVGAMLAEYVWDSERERTAGPGARLLERELGRYAADIGLFESLGARELVDFAARWLLDESDLASESDARALLEALSDFCRWSEERHAHPLWSAFQGFAAPLAESVPRLVALRAALARGAPDPESYRVRAVAAGRVHLARDDGEERTVTLAPPEAARLRAGDVARLVTRPDGTFLCRVYPGVLQDLLAELRERSR